jgi:hypothetical protein
MQYWVINQAGQIVASIPDTDPDFQRVLQKPQYRAPAWVQPVGAPAPVAPPSQDWATPPPAPHPSRARQAVRMSAPLESAAYRIRHVPTGKFLTSGLKPEDADPRKIKNWLSEGDARNAIAHAVRRGIAARSEFEIVPVQSDMQS